MAWIDNLLGREPSEKITSITQVRPGVSNGSDPELKNSGSWGQWQPIYYQSFDGEKNTGEIGKIKKYSIDYYGLRLRSWQSYLESDITQDIVKKFALWVVGNGLKLQSEPKTELIKDLGEFNREEWTRDIESRFSLFCNSEQSDFKQMDDYNTLNFEAFKSAIVGGDVLCVHRFKDGKLSTQFIDGELVINPPLQSKEYKSAEQRGNKIRHGVEIDKRGTHVAYFVKQTDGSVLRIQTRGTRTKHHFAYLIYGLKYRLDSVRGLPLIAVVMESIKKIDRYKEATIGSAEERAKVVYSIEHAQFSTGENPLMKNVAASFNANARVEDEDLDKGEQTAQKVAKTTTRQAFNMPIGAQMKALESKNELYFKDFFSTHVNLICATIGIPPEIALSKYDSNFSASRAALKDWEHTMKVTRKFWANQTYKRFYSLWFTLQALTDKIPARGFAAAWKVKDWLTLEAYKFARFVGANVPHIDPVKEVQAERMKLGALGVNLPLSTAEAATENLSEGDFTSNAEQFMRELNGFEVQQSEPNNSDDPSEE